jgi:exosome complex component RRP41
MSRSIEYVNACGLRVDGRRPGEVRRLSAALGCAPSCDGSALLELGGTRVLATVRGPRRPARRGEAEEEHCTITVSFTQAPFATAERRVRRAGDRKLVEACGALQASYQAAVLTRLYPRAEISVSLHVLASDGGALVAALNAGTLALIDAGIAMRDFVAAAGVLHVGGRALLDPSGAETQGGAPELLVATLPASGALVMTTMDARLPAEAFPGLLAAAVSAAAMMHEVMRGFVGERARARVRALEGGGEEGEEDEEGEEEGMRGGGGGGGALEAPAGLVLQRRGGEGPLPVTVAAGAAAERAQGAR